MQKPINRIEFVYDFQKKTFSEDLHAKRILSLANGALGALTGPRWRSGEALPSASPLQALPQSEPR